MTTKSDPVDAGQSKSGVDHDREDPHEERLFRSTPDWSEKAINGDHLWVPTTKSGDLCFASDADCAKHGSRVQCSSCKSVAHVKCTTLVLDKSDLNCKPTFRDVSIRQYREHTYVNHHWVHYKSFKKGKCKTCSKLFQSKLCFSTKEIVALSCSWCKSAYHNKQACFPQTEEECTLGELSSIIVPPTWIVKLPLEGSFKSSLRKSPKKKQAPKAPNMKDEEKSGKNQQAAFVIKPIPKGNITPVIVFINPKSGGNQGVKLLRKFQWLLNPRQVFDLTLGGPNMGLELFRSVPNLRILACGGDGTVGWILSVLDRMKINPTPPIAVLPLGTGNDLARALGWGGGYTDEPVLKILRNIADAQIKKLDRWELKVEKNMESQSSESGKDNLPLNVINNYFSFGVDAQIALEFHEAREAQPQKFNSRLKNKFYYGQMGGKDLLNPKWKNLSDVVTIECDGKDITPILKEHKVHAVVFINIPSYGGGTHPWNKSISEQTTDDGLIEVLSLTTYQLPLLQAGGHGTCICQCKTARIVTTKAIPMQVDGEACNLNPSIITLSFLNQAQMLSKCKGLRVNNEQIPEKSCIPVYKIKMTDYEQYHYDKLRLKETAANLGEINVSSAALLEEIRPLVDKLLEGKSKSPIQWCFLDSWTFDRFFRIDRAQEPLYYLMDIAREEIFVLHTTAQTPNESR